MSDRELDEHLSRISTNWTDLRQAHQGSEDAAARARQLLMERYCGAVYRYLLRAVRDPHVAEDLTQEFALRFIRGLFRQADPARGRFRDYVKTSLFHLVDDYRRREARGLHAVPLENNEPADPESPAQDAERAFLDSWRAELLSRTWHALAADRDKPGQPLYAVLRLRVEHPDLTSAQMADQLTCDLGRPFTAAGVRQLLHRARERFAEHLIRETTLSLGSQPADQVEQELADLNLLKYCRAVLDKRERAAE
jgi:RNA polymerase sigma-70 factor (ECF subfamily)